MRRARDFDFGSIETALTALPPCEARRYTNFKRNERKIRKKMRQVIDSMKNAIR
jgi:hypothetical protein